MVERHPQRVNRKAVIVDLDGTLIAGNTFRRFIQYIIRIYLRNFKTGKIARLSAIISLRLLRIIDHAEMKRRILLLSADICSSSDMHKFAFRLLENVNDNVATEIERLQTKGHPVYLATAAPDIYSRHIAEIAGFDGVIATPFPQSGIPWAETRGDLKLLSTKKLTETAWFTIWRVYTDHIDDMPLIVEASEVVLVNPKPNTTKIVAEAGIKFRTLD